MARSFRSSVLLVIALVCGTSVQPARAQPPAKATAPAVTAQRDAGYVYSYTVHITTDDRRYFVVTLSDSPKKSDKPRSFALARTAFMEQVDEQGGKLRAVPYATVTAAAIALIKDAAINNKRVEVEYFQLVPKPPGTDAPIIRSVKLIND